MFFRGRDNYEKRIIILFIYKCHLNHNFSHRLSTKYFFPSKKFLWTLNPFLLANSLMSESLYFCEISMYIGSPYSKSITFPETITCYYSLLTRKLLAAPSRGSYIGKCLNLSLTNVPYNSLLILSSRLRLNSLVTPLESLYASKMTSGSF